MDNRTEPLAPGVWRIEVGVFTNAYLIARDGHGDADGLVLVDTGSCRAAPRLVRSIRMLGFVASAVDTVLLTHWHADHAGSAPRFAASAAGSAVKARPPDDAVVAGATAPVVSASRRVGRVLQRGVPRPQPVECAPLGDEETQAGGLQVVAAPGHTLGHTAFWLPEHGVLLAGDAVFGILRVATGPRVLQAAPEAAPDTLRRLAGLDPAVVALGHGPPLRRSPALRLARLAERAAPR